MPDLDRVPGGNEFYVGQAPHQMYVQHWAPAVDAPTRPFPLVLIHGGAHTGAVWTSTPDGRPGWAPYLAERGWPVYVVDWPGVGRSGFAPDYLTMGPTPIVDAVLALLDRIGPAGLVGWSIGGAVSFTVADRAPERVRAVVGVAPSAPSNTTIVRPAEPVDGPRFPSREQVRSMFANADRFPHAAFEQYFASLVPNPPRIVNVVRAAGPEFWIDHPEAVRRRPILFVIAEQDAQVTPDRSEPAAAFYGVAPTRVGADWGLPGHGHLMMVDEDNLAIAARIADWLESGPPPVP
jgi:pimeloyl-ACP methyl ester carboxylesterase